MEFTIYNTIDFTKYMNIEKIIENKKRVSMDGGASTSDGGS